MATIEDFQKVDIIPHPRQIGPFVSEVLTLGVPDKDGKCVLIVPDKDSAEAGGKMF